MATSWNDRQVKQLVDRIGIRFSPVLGDYLTEGFAACPTCSHHVITRCEGPVRGGRLVRLTVRCPRCNSTAERDYLEVSIGRTVPCFRREAAY